MTLREIFAALGRGWWIVVLAALATVAIAFLAVMRLEPSYTSTGTVRANPFLTSAALNGQVAGIAVDVDPSVIRTSTVLAPAAAALGVREATLQDAVTYEVLSDAGTSTVTVTATAGTPRRAGAYAQAVLTGYADHVTQSIQAVSDNLQGAVAATTGQVQGLQAQLAAAPDDPVAAQNLAAALATLSAQTVRLGEVQTGGNLLTVVAPVAPGQSDVPATASVLGLALLCGLLAGAGLVLLIDRFDDRLRSPDEVEALTGVAVLGELPYDRSAARRRDKNRLPAASGRQGILGERLRSLRTSIQVLLPDGRGVVVITSVEPGDGKTFVSSNLAVSWSRAGRKVVLVGGDMRRPELEEYFPDVAGHPGLSDLLALRVEGRRSPTQAQIEDVLVGTGFRGLRALPPGSETDDAADLLGAANLPRILGFASRIADVVVVDSPPALALTDASELARSADGVVLIATIRRTRRRLLRAAVETISGNDAVLLGIVVNRSRRRLPRTYASYYMPRRDERGSRSEGRARGDERESRSDGRRRRAASRLEAEQGGATTASDERYPTSDSDLEVFDPTLTGRDRRLAALGLDELEER